LAEAGNTGGEALHDLIDQARRSRGATEGRVYRLLEEAWQGWERRRREFEDLRDIEEWKSPGGWLYELTDDAAPWTRREGAQDADEAA
jgi:hypothetical protein